MNQDVRLQKVIAQAGIASRRKAEMLIAQGQVSVNGKRITTLGTTVDPSVDVIAVNGRRLARRVPLHYVLLYKPKGYVTTCNDEAGRRTVLDLLKRPPGRLFPVGRLDVNSEGVLLLTNDGQLANQLLHPRHRIPRVYLVKVPGVVAVEDLQQLRRGVSLDDGKTLPARVQVMRQTEKNSLLRFTLFEGRNRQIHRMLQRCGGHGVKALQRVAMGPLTTAGMLPGRFRHLEPFEVDRLKEACAPGRTA